MAWSRCRSRKMQIVPMASAGIDDQVMARDRGAVSPARTARWKARRWRADDQREGGGSGQRVQSGQNIVFLARCTPTLVCASYASCCLLLVSDKQFGVFVLYTSKPEFFDAAGSDPADGACRQCRVRASITSKGRSGSITSPINDALTGLANRSLFIDRVRQPHAQRRERRAQTGRLLARSGAGSRNSTTASAGLPVTCC